MEDDGDGPVRRFRGSGSLKFLDTLQPGQRFQVKSGRNSPVKGQNSTYLSIYISHLTRDGNKFPLTVKHWNSMPYKCILNAISEIKKIFDYPVGLDDWIKTKLHVRWKTHKFLVKKQGFYKYTTREQRLAHRPKDVVESQWVELLEYWQRPNVEAKCAGYKVNGSIRRARQSSGARSHGIDAAKVAAKLKRAPTTKEIYDATQKKRKTQMVGLENKQCQHSSTRSSKKMKMSAEASGSRGKKAVSKNKPLRRSIRLNKLEHLTLSSSNSTPTSPVHLVQECLTEDGEDTMEARLDEPIDGFGYIGEPVEAAIMTSLADPSSPVHLIQECITEDGVDNMQVESIDGLGSVGEPVEAAKTTSSAKCPTVNMKLLSTSSAKDISAPFVGSTSVSVRGRDEEFEFVDNFKIPKEYAVLYKKIFEKYGHMATRKVIKSNDTILVACVSSLLEMISTMETMRGADLSESLLQTWEGDIEDVENLGFNIKWLREKFDEVKNNWKTSSTMRKEVEIHEKELDATQVKYASLLARRDKLHQEISEVIVEIREAETKISSEKMTMDEPILGKLLS